jgi:release factor glutamine methyltransferase
MTAAVLSVDEWLAKGGQFLGDRRVPEASASVEFLMAAVLGVGRGSVRAEGRRRLTEKQGNHFWNFVKERGRRVPLAYILGTQPFCGHEIKVSPAVLVPRPETEGLVECAVDVARTRLPSGTLHIVDIGTGSGCIPVAIAHALPDAVLYATEISPQALRVAEENFRSHGIEARVRLVREDLFKGGGAPAWADMVVCNPPYIPSKEIPDLEPELHHEPVLALDGGKDGLEAIRAVVTDSPRMLKPGGWLLLEIGFGQAAKVREILERRGLRDVEVRKDLAGIERVCVSRRPQMLESGRPAHG